tara:strand:- start:82 stop:387 length:306 start_codon:yes stop_codon:yes gene_type:complete
MLSKKASMNEKSRLERKNGKDPKIAILNQDKALRRKACCRFNFLFSSKFVSIRRVPIKAVTTADDRKVLSPSLYKNWTKNGISMKIPSIIRSTPIAKKTVL